MFDNNKFGNSFAVNKKKYDYKIISIFKIFALGYIHFVNKYVYLSLLVQIV